MADRRWCLITGASSGIGAVFARKLAAQGYNLALAARRADRLEALRSELAHVEVAPIPVDLSKDEEMERVAAWIAAGPPLDLLVNNAGFGTLGLFHETDYAMQREMHQLHVMATMRLTRAALERMVPRNRGAIVCVASVAGFFRSAGNVSYCATKGWMNHFCEGIHLELQSIGSAVRIQALCPGFTYTEFHDVMKVDRGAVAKWMWMDANDVVEESLKGLEAGRLFVVPGWQYRWGVRLLTRLPTAWRLRLEADSPHRRKPLPEAEG